MQRLRNNQSVVGHCGVVKGLVNVQLYLYMLANSLVGQLLVNNSLYWTFLLALASRRFYCWKWSSLNCASVQNRVHISVHSPVHILGSIVPRPKSPCSDMGMVSW
jgi:hypothetical protein